MPCPYLSGFPLGLEKWEGIFQAGKITQNTGKVRELQTKVYSYLLSFSDIQINCVLFAKMDHVSVDKTKH